MLDIQEQQPQPRDAAYWASPVQRLTVSEVPTGAVNLNVQGRRVTGPIQGFGQLWQKTFRVRLVNSSMTPADVIKLWKEQFTSLWPRGNTFYAPLKGIRPGEVALISLATLPGPVRLSTGVMVMYADDESFTLITPEGHYL